MAWHVAPAQMPLRKLQHYKDIEHKSNYGKVNKYVVAAKQHCRYTFFATQFI